MIPKLHKGTSFRGLAEYCLHDKDRAATSDRVVWTETRNLATRNPDAAWRVMASTAMSQDYLKERAGGSKVGRKTTTTVEHLTLSWHPDESETLTREEMVRAAELATGALGAEEHQALWVCHDDSDHPHLHLIINRIHPETGKALPSSRERLRLSKFALEYEKDRGRVLCENRELNWRARDRGEYTRGQKDRARHLHELEAANDGGQEAESVRAEQRGKDHELGERTRRLRDRQAAERAKLDDAYRNTRAGLRAEGETKKLRRINEVRREFRPAWEERARAHRSELAEFEDRERRVLGRVSNALQAIDFGELLRSNTRSAALKDAYNALASRGGREVGLRRRQHREDAALKAEQDQAERAATLAERRKLNERLRAQRLRYLTERASLVMTQRLERAKNRAEWRTRGRQRREAYEKVREHAPARDAGPREHADADSRRKRVIESFRQKRARERDSEQER